MAEVQKLRWQIDWCGFFEESLACKLPHPFRMGVGRHEDLVAHQFAEEFKLEVYGLIDASPGAKRDFDFKDQLRGAASGVGAAVAEGFGRCHAPEFVTFLRYALASLAEARGHVKDGIDRGHFAKCDCDLAFTWARRCRPVLRNLLASQLRLIEADNASKARRKRRRRS